MASLVDDFPTARSDRVIAVLDQHPNIYVRIWNPSRQRLIGRNLEYLVRLRELALERADLVQQELARLLRRGVARLDVELDVGVRDRVGHLRRQLAKGRRRASTSPTTGASGPPR